MHHQEHAPEAAAPGASEMRARLAAARERNEATSAAARPAPAPVAAGPAVPGVPPEVVAGLARVLASGRLSASEAGLAIGMSKSAAHRHLSVMRDAGIVEMEGTGNAIGWRLAAREQAAPPQYTTIEALAQAVHDGLVEADDEQRAVLEQAWQIAHRPHLTVIHGSGGDGL